MAKQTTYEVTITTAEGNKLVLKKVCRRCTTRKGFDDQHNRVVNEFVNMLRESNFTYLKVAVLPSS